MKVLILLKKNFISLLFLVFTIFLVVFSSSNLLAARNGLTLWANNVLPALFPFFVAVELLNHTDIIYFLSNKLNRFMKPIFNVPGIAAYPFIMGLISGYPVGAKIVSSLYSEGSCSKDEAERILAFTNNSGPLFIIGTVGTAFYGNSSIGIILLITHVLASITVGLILSLISKFRKKNSISENIISSSSNIKSNKEISISELGSILGSSILSATKTILMIGGFVTLFSVIISILNRSGILLIISTIFSKIFNIDSRLVLGTITGIIEFTNGLNLVSTIHLKNISINLIISAFIIGFGGISVTLQVLSIISQHHLSVKKYIKGKILHGLIAALYTFLILQIPMFNLNL